MWAIKWVLFQGDENIDTLCVFSWHCNLFKPKENKNHVYHSDNILTLLPSPSFNPNLLEKWIQSFELVRFYSSISWFIEQRPGIFLAIQS